MTRSSSTAIIHSLSNNNTDRRAPTCSVEEDFDMAEQRFAFGWSLLMLLKQRPGVFELFDEEGTTIYIEGASNIHQCLKRHLSKPGSSYVWKRAKVCGCDYREDYREQEQLMLKFHRDIFGTDPVCNTLFESKAPVHNT